MSGLATSVLRMMVMMMMVMMMMMMAVMMIMMMILRSSWNHLRNPNDFMVNCSIAPGDFDMFLQPYKKPC